jgi:hypothetical protein
MDGVLIEQWEATGRSGFSGHDNNDLAAHEIPTKRSCSIHVAADHMDVLCH